MIVVSSAYIYIRGESGHQDTISHKYITEVVMVLVQWLTELHNCAYCHTGNGRGQVDTGNSCFTYGPLRSSLHVYLQIVYVI